MKAMHRLGCYWYVVHWKKYPADTPDSLRSKALGYLDESWRIGCEKILEGLKLSRPHSCWDQLECQVQFWRTAENYYHLESSKS